MSSQANHNLECEKQWCWTPTEVIGDANADAFDRMDSLPSPITMKCLRTVNGDVVPIRTIEVAD